MPPKQQQKQQPKQQQPPKQKQPPPKGSFLSKTDLAGIQTCADKIKKDKVDNVVKKIDTKKTPNSKKGGAPTLRAAFLKGKILTANTILKCGFMSLPPPGYVRSSTSFLQSAVDKNGVSIPLDPLQLEVDKMDVIPAVIHTITTRLQPIINIKFKFYENEEEKTLYNPAVCDIRITFNPRKGAWSFIGKDILDEKDKTIPTLNLGWFDVPTTLHEFCHAVGMIHEHQNPLGDPINWNVPAVLEWAMDSQGWDEETTKTNIINKYKKDQINGSEYDPLSIMLYFFPKILVNNEEGKCCGQGTQQNYQFSPYDVLFLNKIYPRNDQDLQPPEFTVKFFNDNFNQQVDIEKLKDQIKKNSKEGYLFYEGLEDEKEETDVTEGTTDVTTGGTTAVTSGGTTTGTTGGTTTGTTAGTTAGTTGTVPPVVDPCKLQKDALNSCVITKGSADKCKDEQNKLSECEKNIPHSSLHSLQCTASKVIMMDFPSSLNQNNNSCGCGEDNLFNANNRNEHGENKNKNKSKRVKPKKNQVNKIITFFTIFTFLILLLILLNYMWSSYSNSSSESEETKV